MTQGETILAFEVFASVVCWSIVTWSNRKIIRERPIASGLILVLIWATLFAQASRSLSDIGLLGPEWPNITAGITRGIYLLAGFAVIIGVIPKEKPGD